jgi:hypothetical protein
MIHLGYSQEADIDQDGYGYHSHFEGCSGILIMNALFDNFTITRSLTAYNYCNPIVLLGWPPFQRSINDTVRQMQQGPDQYIDSWHDMHRANQYVNSSL